MNPQINIIPLSSSTEHFVFVQLTVLVLQIATLHFWFTFTALHQLQQTATLSQNALKALPAQHQMAALQN